VDEIPRLEATLACVLVLGVTAWLVLRSYGVQKPTAQPWAIFRGGLQLAIIGVVLQGVISNPWLVSLALVVMFTVASVTATRRNGWSWGRYSVTAGSMAVGVSVSLVVIFGSTAVEVSGRYLLALGGIVIGNSMTIATLVGRQLREVVRDHWDEIEGWLALGATNRQATIEIARHAVYSALIPSTDQTRTTGLVTLPGAFVGAIFGGLSPLEAGRFQIVVLAAIMCAGAITAVLAASALAPRELDPKRRRGTPVPA
jgi:putative ABC transport system permease protein